MRRQSRFLTVFVLLSVVSCVSDPGPDPGPDLPSSVVFEPAELETPPEVNGPSDIEAFVEWVSGTSRGHRADVLREVAKFADDPEITPALVEYIEAQRSTDYTYALFALDILVLMETEGVEEALYALAMEDISAPEGSSEWLYARAVPGSALEELFERKTLSALALVEDVAVNHTSQTVRVKAWVELLLDATPQSELARKFAEVPERDREPVEKKLLANCKTFGTGCL